MTQPASVASVVEAFFVRHRERFVYVHLVFFVFFLILLFAPLFSAEAKVGDTQWTNFALFANYVMWGLWFPLTLASVIFTGRSWCGLFCPMGAASEWSSRVGLKRPIPAWLRWEGTPIVSFVVITVLGQTVGVREHPESVAIIFGGTMLCAIVFGLLFTNGKRPWCRHACPVGLLLGLFSRLGIVHFQQKKIIHFAKTSSAERYAERGLCPTMIDIKRKDESRHCIECFKCVHPQSSGGLQLRFRPPGAEVEQIRTHHPNITEVVFFFVAIGTALGGFLWLTLESYQHLRRSVGEWALAQGWSWIGNSGPGWLMSVHPARGEVFSWLDFFMIAGFMLACAAATALVLGLMTLAAAFLAGEEGGDGTLASRFLELGYQFAPVSLVSLIIGLGSKLFMPLDAFGADAPGIAKEVLFAIGFLWSLRLGYRLLGEQGIAPAKRWLPLMPGVVGSCVIGIAWWVAIFGAIEL